jgi:hypothetical protein
MLNRSTLPVFQQDWWLAAARGDTEYREITVREGGSVVGSLPFIVKKFAFGVHLGTDPHWSHLGGPVLCDGLSERSKAAVLEHLIEELPRKISYHFCCNSQLPYAALVRQAFERAGFASSTLNTYIRRPASAHPLAALRHKARGHINAARRNLELTEIQSGEFIDFYDRNLAMRCRAQSMAPLSVAQSLIAEGHRRGRVRLRVARSKNRDSNDAAIACAWDEQRYYYWMSTRPPRGVDPAGPKPHPDAIKLLIVDAIEHAESLGLIFDADGSSTPGSEHLYRDLLKLPIMQARSVFQREAGVARLYRRYRDTIHRCASVAGLGHVLRPRAG